MAVIEEGGGLGPHGEAPKPAQGGSVNAGFIWPFLRHTRSAGWHGGACLRGSRAKGNGFGAGGDRWRLADALCNARQIPAQLCQRAMCRGEGSRTGDTIPPSHTIRGSTPRNKSKELRRFSHACSC